MRVRKRDAGELVERVKELIGRAGQVGYAGPAGQVGPAGLAGDAGQAAHAPMRLPDISRAVGVSASYLAATFKRIERTTIHRYVVNQRLSRAAAALLAGCDDMTVLALNLGFASPSHFSTAFRRWAGCTPTLYRARLRARAQAGKEYAGSW
jgi:AraC-like DNA-binding protein